MLGLGDRRREIEHYANLGVLLDASNRHVEAQAALGHVISLTRAEGDRSSELVVLSNLGSSLHDVGKVAAALVPLREALRLKELYPELRTSAVFVQVQMGNMERALGHYAEALRWLEAGRAILGEYLPKVVGAAHIGLAHLWLDLGQAARARQQLDLRWRSALARRCSMPSPTCWRRERRWRRASVMPRPEALAGASGLHHRLDALRGPGAGDPPRHAIAGAGGCVRERPGGRPRSRTAAHDGFAHRRARLRGARRPGLRPAAVASTHALEALGLWPEHAPDAVYIGDVLLTAIESSSDDDAIAAILDAARRWIEAAAGRPSRGVPRFLSLFAIRPIASLLARAASRPAES